MRQFTALVCTAAALTLAACADEPTRPTKGAARAVPDASSTAAAPLSLRQMSAGGRHTCGVTTGGATYCWGLNANGELGIGTNAGPERCVDLEGNEFPCSTRPVRAVGRLAFREVAAGGHHTCGVTTENVAYCWGSNFVGQLGDGTTTSRLAPVRVAGGLTFRHVSAGEQHTCGVTTANVAYCWGENASGQLGNGNSTGPADCGGVPCSLRPVRVVGRLAVRQVNAGGGHTCGVTSDGVAYCWGSNSTGQLGVGAIDAFAHPRPLRVAGGLAVRQLNLGRFHTCGTITADVAYCWGLNIYGQLGIGTSTGPERCAFGEEDDAGCSSRPVRVAGGPTLRRVNAGFFHTCGLTAADVAYCWGHDGEGQLGNGDSRPETCSDPVFVSVPCSPRPVRVVGGLAFRTVSGGFFHTCGIATGARSYCWGENTFGQLGDGTSGNIRTRPVAVVSP